MKIKDVIKRLQQFDPGLEIYFSIDEEGNVYHVDADIEETEFEDGEIKAVVYPRHSNKSISFSETGTGN